MKFISTFLLLLVFVCIVNTSYAWGVTGHRVVAEIAQKHLSKKAKKALTEIIGKESLSWWANWPDFIKSDTTHAWDSAIVWHYVDLPGHIDKATFINQLKALPGKNLYTQIPAMLQKIKDGNNSIEERKYALAFLVHLVGDLHQPLHVGRDEDQGGNKITVYWFDKKTNLHSVWDASLIDFQQYSYTEYAKELDIADNTLAKQWQASSLEDWFYESHQLSDKIYDLSPNEAKLSYKYSFIFKADLDLQLLKAGLRLAALINNLFV